MRGPVVEQLRSGPLTHSVCVHSPQGDRGWPEFTNRKRLELLLSFWEARLALLCCMALF